MVLRAKGPQDLSLTLNPEITFFKAVYPRHSNFAWEDVEIQQTAGTNSWGSEVSFTLTRSGDLITALMLQHAITPVAIAAIGDNGAAAIDQARFLGYVTSFDGSLNLSGQKLACKTFVDDVGRALIDEVSLSIGGFPIETHTGDWLHVWDSLTRVDAASYARSLDASQGGSAVRDDWDLVNRMTKYELQKAQSKYNTGASAQTIYVPMEFTCCTSPGLALPMIAIQYHDVRIKVKTKPRAAVSLIQASGSDFVIKGTGGANRVIMTGQQIVDAWQKVNCEGYATTSTWGNVAAVIFDDASTGTPTSGISAGPTALTAGTKYYVQAPLIKVTGGDLQVKLLTRFIFLDDVERKNVALGEQNFLITETQKQVFSISSTEANQTLNLYFNHPHKELVMFFRRDTYEDATSAKVVTNYWDFTMDGSNSTALIGSAERPEAFTKMNLSLNQQKLFQDGRDAQYFGYLMPLQFHARVPRARERLYVIPFGLDPESWRPSGTINFSRIDTAQLLLDFTGKGSSNLPTGNFYVYGRNFNELKIKSGMGGLRFAS